MVVSERTPRTDLKLGNTCEYPSFLVNKTSSKARYLVLCPRLYQTYCAYLYMSQNNYFVTKTNVVHILIIRFCNNALTNNFLNIFNK